MSTAIAFLELAIIIVLLLALIYQRLETDRARGDVAQLKFWLLGNLHHLVGLVGFAHPQVPRVVSSVERCLPSLLPLDCEKIREDLNRMKREYTAQITEETQHWCKVRAAAEAEARKGAELPLTP